MLLAMRASSLFVAAALLHRVQRQRSARPSSSTIKFLNLFPSERPSSHQRRHGGSVNTTRKPKAAASADKGDNVDSDIHLMEDMLYRIRDVNYMPDDIRKSLLEFRISEDCPSVGKVRPSIAKMLTSMNVDDRGPIFMIVDNNDSNSSGAYLTFTENAGSTFESRSESVGRVMEKLRDDGIVRGWRDELYPVRFSFNDPPAFVMERAAVSLLGAIEYGVHINGIVSQIPMIDEQNSNKQSAEEIRMWIARRSRTKSKYPGMLDHVVAGGQPADISLMDNCVKECLEEAGIPEDITRSGIRSAGAVSYETYEASSDTIARHVLFNYDLYLPADFKPKAVDGEVEEFVLWSIDEVLRSLSREYHDPIKPNCYLVIIDFLLRHGFVSPEVPGYLDVLRELRSGDCK